MKKFLQQTTRIFQKNLKKGFTLIEMIIVLALVATLTTLVLFNQGKLNSAILVSNTAYEIGLIVRESQVAGLGVKAAANTTTGVAEFTSSHGVHFDVSTPSKIILFADKNNNGIYDPSNTEMTQEFEIQNKRAGTILEICAQTTTATGTCVIGNGTYTHAQTADVVFTRPNPEAFFQIRPIGLTTPQPHVGALIINVGFANDLCRSITLQKTGAVQVDTQYCPPMQ